jgi:peptidoglycan DL-endopeptidase CwlO
MAVSGLRRRWRLALVFAVLATIGSLLSTSAMLVITPAPAFADPNTDDEGATKDLATKLEQVAQSYYDIRSKLTLSRKSQAQIKDNLRLAEISLVRLTTQVDNIAAGRYKGERLGVLDGLFTGVGKPQELLNGAALQEYLVWHDDEQLRQLRQAQQEAAHQQALLDAEVANEAKQLGELDKQKRAAEKALAAVGGLVTAGYSGAVPAAQPAPRTPSGGFAPESATLTDPTGTGGKITPRMYHALTEARLAGFRRFTRCWRTQSWGEHPKGRACDFSVSTGGFGGIATGGDKTYGNRLAAWCKQNAEALGVLYVIWFRQIWMPGIGWRAYSGTGDPSSEHTNHVHLSVI